jgi:hypothetical protein
MEVTKKSVIVVTLLLAVSFALGRYTVPAKTVVEEKLVYVEKKEKTKEVETEKKKNVVTVKVEETKPDGTKTVTTRTEEKTDTTKFTNTKESTHKQLTQESSKTTDSRDRVTISALLGISIPTAIDVPIYGASVSKPIVGPIALGVWGLSSGTVGVSVGLQF